MRKRWIGLSGVAMLLTALLLNLLGSWLWPAAYWGSAAGGMSARMGGSMMGSGMMVNGALPQGKPGDASQPFDLRFLDNMIVHHQNAVIMAQTMIADSQRPELRDLAQRIIVAQQREIEQMRQWRRDWYGAAGTSTMPEAMMEQMGSGRMMNREQMRQMMGGSVDFDRMFLQMMIPHHEGAIDMAQLALEQAEHSEIKTLAQDIVTTQRAEIQEMQTYLRDWYGEQP
jgi:uncharacterized protein (DUF305 family)